MVIHPYDGKKRRIICHRRIIQSGWNVQDFVLWRELTNLTISPEILIEFLHCILRKQLPILIIVFTSCKNEVVRFWYIKFLIFLWNSEYCELKKIFMERPILYSN